jgi:hypothetical protein
MRNASRENVVLEKYYSISMIGIRGYVSFSNYVVRGRCEGRSLSYKRNSNISVILVLVDKADSRWCAASFRLEGRSSRVQMLFDGGC